MNTPVLQFVHRGELVSLRNVPPTRTLLQLLREDLGLSATKEGCNQGDCGACTVVVGELHGERIQYSAVNSCIRLAHALQGRALWTAADLAGADGTLHPVQQALLHQHASQCGFCTPGIAMSLFGLYQNRVCQGQPVGREQAQEALSGNLCRCTGYRPILEAAQQMAALPLQHLDEPRLHRLLQDIAASATPPADACYRSPTTLAALLAERAAHPQAQIVAGGTDVGLWINQLHQDYDTVLDLSRVHELHRIDSDSLGLRIGAAATLNEAFAALQASRPSLKGFAQRFASLPVRNAGTLGGNVVNGSPIGDAMPLLIALRASVVLASVRGERALALTAFYSGYRRNVMAADEVLAWIDVPHARPGELLRIYKVSKRMEDDISTVCLALCLQLDAGVVTDVSIGVGGVAATPVRARQTEAALAGQAWTQAAVHRAMTSLRTEFQPISDMRASSGYRIQVLGNLLQRFWLESQGHSDTSLANCALQEDAP